MKETKSQSIFCQKIKLLPRIFQLSSLDLACQIKPRIMKKNNLFSEPISGDVSFTTKKKAYFLLLFFMIIQLKLNSLYCFLNYLEGSCLIQCSIFFFDCKIRPLSLFNWVSFCIEDPWTSIYPHSFRRLCSKNSALQFKMKKKKKQFWVKN